MGWEIHLFQCVTMEGWTPILYWVRFSQNKQWSLEACVSYALENNISIKQAQNNILSNEQDLISTKGKSKQVMNNT